MTLSYCRQRSSVLLFLALAAVVAIFSACGKPATVASLLADAKQYQNKGDAKAAVIQLKNILRQNPHHGEARYLLGSIYTGTGDALRAERQFREALSAKYDNKLVLPLLAQALFQQGKFQQVLDETRVSDHGDIALQPEILSLRGHSQLSLGLADEAAHSFGDALKRDPHFAQALLGQVRLAIQKQNAPAALEFADTAVTANPNNIDGWLMKGDIERALNHPDAAMAAYRKALDLRPKDVAPNLNLASMSLAAGKFEESRKYIQAIRAAAPNAPVGDYLLGLIEFRNRDYKAANEALQRVLKTSPNYAPAKILAGVVAYSLGDTEQAEQRLRGGLLLYPDNRFLRKLLGATLIKAHKPEKALEVLAPLINAPHPDAAMLELTATAYFQNNDLAKARRYFEMAAKQNPDDANVRAGLGLARLATGETGKALVDLEAAMGSGNSEADMFVVGSLVSARQFSEALAAVQRLEKNRPNDPDILNTKGTVQFARNDFSAARQSFERVIALKPDHFPALMNLAALELREKRPQAARMRYAKILQQSPSNIEAMLALARIASGAGEQSEAITWLERAKGAQPEAFAPNFRLAEMLFERRDYARAIPVFKDALATQSEHPQALNMLAYAQLQTGKISESVSTYTKLAAIYPKSAQAQYGLSAAQAASGNRAGAMIALQRALELQPDFPEAIRALATLALKTGKINDALKLAMQAQKRYPKSELGFLIEGDARIAGNEYAQAARAYMTAFGYQRSGPVLMTLHNAMRKAGRGTEADTLLSNWLKDNPEDTQTRLYYADAAIKQANYPLAILQYRYVLQKQPGNLGTLHNLGWAYRQQNETVKALEVAEQAYKINSDAPGPLYDLASLLLNGGDTNRAVKLLDKARLMLPTSPEIRYQLAQAHLKAGDKAQARSELEQVLRDSPDFSERPRATELFNTLNR